MDEILMFAEMALMKMEALRRVDQKKILEFAEHIKDKEGQKYVFMFYQRELISDNYNSRFFMGISTLFGSRRPGWLQTDK